MHSLTTCICMHPLCERIFKVNLFYVRQLLKSSLVKIFYEDHIRLTNDNVCEAYYIEVKLHPLDVDG